MSQIQTGILMLVLAGLLSGCLQKDSIYNENDGEKYQSIIWGNDTSGSIYLNPAHYAEHDPLGKLQKKVFFIGEMIGIPGGSYLMGGDGGASDEQPVHRVNIKAFKLGRHEVTQKQWRTVMGNNPSTFNGCDECPVESVSWYAVQDFIKTLNQQYGQHFRLPSEAEWEYACRSGGKDEMFCGSEKEHLLSWYNGNSGLQTSRVGQKSPNSMGLYDMSGNAWEWVQDCWNDSYVGAPSDSSAWNKGDCEYRVLRGGSWFHNSFGLRSTYRGRGEATNSLDSYGFRLAHD